jgi:hypothetical protein
MKVTSFHLEVKRKALRYIGRNNKLPKKAFNELTTAYEQALRHSLLFYSSSSLIGIQNKSRFCDARIESILLDVNNKEGTESLW